MTQITRKQVVVARKGRVAKVDPKLAKELEAVTLDGEKGALITAFGKVAKADQGTFRARIVAAWRQRADVPKDDNGDPTIRPEILWTPGEEGQPQVFAKVEPVEA